jgi:hypothetical protein
MDPQKKEKGFLTGAFRKAVLTAVAGVTLAIGAAGFATEANAQTTVPYGQQGVTATMQQEDFKPWANNASYQNQIRVQADKDRIAMQRAQSTARQQLATIQQQRTAALARHNNNIKNLRARKNTGALDYANVVAQWTAQEQGFRTRTEHIHLRLEQTRLTQEQTMLRLVERLDNQFSRQEPYKSMLQQQNAPRPAGR